MKQEVKNILENNLPKGFNIIVNERKTFYGTEALKIIFSPNTTQIHNVRGQFPQVVSLNLCLDKLELEPQSFGGNGGRLIYRDIDKNNPSEKYLAMKGVKVPFRKPKKEIEAVKRALKKFCENYIKTLQDNKEVLLYKEVVDYSFLN